MGTVWVEAQSGVEAQTEVRSSVSRSSGQLRKAFPGSEALSAG